MAWICSKMLLRDPSPPFHPPSQPHIMMAACPLHCPTLLLPTTLLSPPRPTNVRKKIKGKAPILIWWVDKMGGCAARRGIGSKTRDGEGWLGVLEEIRGTIQTNSRTLFIWFGWRWPRWSLSRWKDMREMECQPTANCKRDGHVTLLPISLPWTVWVLHQELCSKETE